jgi:hypothetical protein
MNRALILQELRAHAPFTALGALAGIGLLLALFGTGIPLKSAAPLFAILHPLHVLLSAQATTATCYRQCGRGAWRILWVGYVGSVGIATLSDCLIPYAGEWLLDLPNRGLHIGFIERWWLVNPLALAGIGLGVWSAKTRIPHGLHVAVSTGASLFHIGMAMGASPSLIIWAAIAVFLFLAVWIPCCTSDIVFPLLFVRPAAPVRN